MKATRETEVRLANGGVFTTSHGWRWISEGIVATGRFADGEDEVTVVFPLNAILAIVGTDEKGFPDANTV